MTVRPYNQTESQNSQMRTMFDTIAPRYDRINRVLSMGTDLRWRRRLVRMVASQEPDSILDLATGTGDVAIALAGGIDAVCITGADLSEGMLAVAAEKIKNEGLDGRIGLVCAEAEELPFGDCSFDSVTISFGARNFQDLHKGLSETLRVLSPGGKIYVLEFSSPGNKVFAWFYKMYSKTLLPLIGGMVSGDMKAYKYLPRSISRFPSGNDFVDIMLRAGFADCSAVALTGGIASIYTGMKR